MAASGSKHHPPSCSKPPKSPIIEIQTPNPNPNPNPSSSTTPPLPPSQDETDLSREDVIRRRSHYIKELKKYYTRCFWALLEEVKSKHRDFVWKYGVSPFKEEEDHEAGIAEGTGVNNNSNNNNANGGGAAIDRVESDAKRKLQCASIGCKSKAMALTRFCHGHILCDPKQKLYRRCTFSSHGGPLTCVRPILRSTVPALCGQHIQMTQKAVKRALKQAGLTLSSSNKLAPKFHVILAEYVRQIQAKRRAGQRAKGKKVAVKEENAD